MEKSGRDEIILLFDFYNRGSHDLFASFKNAGVDCRAVVINDDGFLPEDVTNIYEYFLGQKPMGKPLYFNQIKVPDYWEISANNTSGSVHDKVKERGRIFFSEPTHKRHVKVVDWVDEEVNVRLSEHYNSQGRLYARTVFNKKSEKVSKSYFDVDDREVIVENFVTSDIILNYGEKTRIFKNRTEFVSYFIKEMGWEKNRIFFNSLSTPFFVSNAMPHGEKKRDILFWQEHTGSEIPGNMKAIFDGLASRCEKVIVQNKASYEKLISLGAPAEKLAQLGFIYSFKKENRGRKEALICTNTENVEKLKEIVEALPEIKFHVTALTEMSGKLLSHEKYENVIMYPNVKMATLDRLFMQCDFFLDINHEGEIVEATRRAFLHNLLILGFEETCHGKEYTAIENIYSIRNYKGLIDRISEMNNHEILQKAMESQHAAALTATVKEYEF